MINPIDLLNLHDCSVRDEDGTVVATLHEENKVITVERTSACSLGAYFYILRYLMELGFEVK